MNPDWDPANFTWSCDECDVVNDPTDKRCHACGADRPPADYGDDWPEPEPA